jgi:hypothetical protein
MVSERERQEARENLKIAATGVALAVFVLAIVIAGSAYLARVLH